jgi:hypothetical protein
MLKQELREPVTPVSLPKADLLLLVEQPQQVVEAVVSLLDGLGAQS